MTRRLLQRGRHWSVWTGVGLAAFDRTIKQTEAEWKDAGLG
jgi:hypothetical protein